LAGVLEEEEEEIKGRAEVLKLFPLPSGDVILGARVVGGALHPGDRIAVWRDPPEADSPPDPPSESEGGAGADAGGKATGKVSKPSRRPSEVFTTTVDEEEKGEPVYRGRIKKLKHGKEEIKEARKDTECGILLKPQFKGVKKGDILEVV